MNEKIKFDYEGTFEIVKSREFSSDGKIDMQPTPTLAWFKLTMVNSLPAVNSKGRAFAYKVLKNSLDTIPHNLVDLEHNMEDFGGNKNEIMGHIVTMELPELSDDETVPNRPVPLKIIGVLYKRLSKVQDILKDYSSGKKRWRSSMECWHDPSEAAFRYEGKFIPVKEAGAEMMKCLNASDVKSYQGKPMAYCLGGEDGKVIFCGDAFTLSPADKGAELESLIASVANDGSISISAEKYNCECIKCGHKITSEEHCNKVKCPECGGQMRRAERPGPGQANAQEKEGKMAKIRIESDGEKAKLFVGDKEIKKINYISFSFFGSDISGIGLEKPVYCSYETIQEEDKNGFRKKTRYELSKDEIKELKEDEAFSETWGKVEDSRWISVKDENTMPDSHFLWIRKKKTSDKSKDRKLPYKYPSGKLSRSGLRGAWAVLHGARGGVDIVGGPGKAELLAKCKRAIGSWNRKNPNDKITIADKGGDLVMDLSERIKKATEGLELNADQITILAKAIEEDTVAAVEEAKKGFVEFKSKEDVQAMIEKALKDGKEAWKEEQENINGRIKKFEESGLKLTDIRKNTILGYAFDDEGNKKFEAYLEDIKAAKGEKASDPKPKSDPPKPSHSGGNDGDKKTKFNV